MRWTERGNGKEVRKGGWREEGKSEEREQERQATNKEQDGNKIYKREREREIKASLSFLRLVCYKFKEPSQLFPFLSRTQHGRSEYLKPFPDCHLTFSASSDILSRKTDGNIHQEHSCGCCSTP